MRRVNYDDYQRTHQRQFLREWVRLANARDGRMTHAAARDATEMKLLGRLIAARRARLLASGELEILGPRRWRWHFPEVTRE
jgi:hypothetical protein